jgi:hypothetical protein
MRLGSTGWLTGPPTDGVCWRSRGSKYVLSVECKHHYGRQLAWNPLWHPCWARGRVYAAVLRLKAQVTIAAGATTALAEAILHRPVVQAGSTKRHPLGSPPERLVRSTLPSEKWTDRQRTGQREQQCLMSRWVGTPSVTSDTAVRAGPSLV